MDPRCCHLAGAEVLDRPSPLDRHRSISLWVIKDLVFYPLLRNAYESSPKTGADQLVGLQGVAQEQIDPRGYIHVRGELWRAETEPGNGPILAGSRVKVLAANGMTLIVAKEDTGATGSG